MQLGIRAVLGTSFAGIFADNAANNGLLLVTLPADQVAVLASRAADPEENGMVVDLEAQAVTAGPLRLLFSVDPLRRDALMRGLDAIGATLDQVEAIREFQRERLAANPWLA